jgi:integrase
MLHTGLLVSEAANLRVLDLVPRERVGLVRIRQCKGRKEREIPLNSSGRRGLRMYLATRDPLEPSDPVRKNWPEIGLSPSRTARKRCDAEATTIAVVSPFSFACFASTGDFSKTTPECSEDSQSPRPPAPTAADPFVARA